MNGHTPQTGTTNCDAQPELAWEAFCYVSGEMTFAEEDVFEQRLAEDQAAREAVAEAVSIVQGVQAAERWQAAQVQAFPQPASRWTRVAAWSSLAAVAAAVLVMILTADHRANVAPSAPPLQASLDTPANTVDLAVAKQLVVAWSQPESFPSDLQDLLSPAPAVADDEIAELQDEELPSTEETGEAAFNWMLAAVSLDEMPHRGTPLTEEN